MVRKKYQSKRLSLHDKHKIKRKIAEHHKQKRREERKNPSLRKKIHKEPGVPKLWGIQQDLFNKLPEQRRAQFQQKKDEEASRKRKRSDVENLNSMAKSATKREKQFNEIEDIKDLGHFNLKDSSKKAFFSEFRKVIKASDVILEVLDARDPLGSRSVNTERSILALDPNKKIILVLNKIDLVPKANVEAWLKYLRNEYPVIAFKASTQKQKTRLGRGKGDVMALREDQLKTSQCLGADTLISLLKNYSRSTASAKQAISVGIIGFPNVGKSSVINSLKRERAVNVGAQAGVTTVKQEITLDKNIKLIDCPGIIFTSDMSESDAALRNCLNLNQLTDFTLPVQAILARCSKENLQTIYSIPVFKDVLDFLRLVSMKRGKMLPGGVADYQTAARVVLQDWNTGRIPYYSIPPETDPSIHVGAEIVNTWGKEFNIEDLLAIEEEQVLTHLPNKSQRFAFAASTQKSSLAPTDAMFNDLAMVDEEDSDNDEEEDSDDEEESLEMEGDSDEEEKAPTYRKESITAMGPIKDKRKFSDPSPPKKRKLSHDAQRNQEAEKQYNKERKDKKKANRNVEVVDEPFNFNVDFWGESASNTTTTTTTTTTNNKGGFEVEAFTFL